MANFKKATTKTTSIDLDTWNGLVDVGNRQELPGAPDDTMDVIVDNRISNLPLKQHKQWTVDYYDNISLLVTIGNLNAGTGFQVDFNVCDSYATCLYESCVNNG